MIKVENLTVKFRNKTALNNISFIIEKGETVALVGQNGAGKSTLLKEILSLAPGRIGWMPESAEPDPNLTVKEFLNFLSEDSSSIEQTIVECGLLSDNNRLCGELSKGTKQRIMFALALLSTDEILILDEPSAGLDPLFQKEMIALIKKFSVNKTVIISTHNMPEIDDLATRIIVLKDGSISFDGLQDDKRSYYEFF